MPVFCDERYERGGLEKDHECLIAKSIFVVDDLFEIFLWQRHDREHMENRRQTSSASTRRQELSSGPRLHLLQYSSVDL